MALQGPGLIKQFKSIIPLLAFVVSITAIMQSCDANRISRKANETAGRTYLWVEPTYISTDDPDFIEVLMMHKISTEPRRYMYLIGSVPAIMGLLAFEIKNTGPHEASDIDLHVELVYEEDIQNSEFMARSGIVPIGTIAPGQTVVHLVAIGIGGPGNPPIEPGIGELFMKYFYGGRLDAKLKAYTTYRSVSSEQLISGTYLGRISNGGQILIREPSGEMAGYAGYLRDWKN